MTIRSNFFTFTIMALPFKNGRELAQALGYGKLYDQAVENEKQQQEVIDGIHEMMRKLKCL